MPEFSIGDSVIDVNSGRHGIVKSVRPPSRGRQAYEVLFANYSEINKDNILGDFSPS